MAMASSAFTTVASFGSAPYKGRANNGAAMMTSRFSPKSQAAAASSWKLQSHRGEVVADGGITWDMVFGKKANGDGGITWDMVFGKKGVADGGITWDMVFGKQQSA